MAGAGEDWPTLKTIITRLLAKRSNRSDLPRYAGAVRALPGRHHCCMHRGHVPGRADRQGLRLVLTGVCTSSQRHAVHVNIARTDDPSLRGPLTDTYFACITHSTCLCGCPPFSEAQHVFGLAVHDQLLVEPHSNIGVTYFSPSVMGLRSFDVSQVACVQTQWWSCETDAVRAASNCVFTPLANSTARIDCSSVRSAIALLSKPALRLSSLE